MSRQWDFVLLTLSVALLLPFSAAAKPTKKIFKATPERVFEAALKVAREHHVVSEVDDKRFAFTFKTGTSMASWGFLANAFVEKDEEGRTVLTVNVQKTRGQLMAWGAGGRTADKFFKWVEEELAKEKPASDAAATEKPMR